MFEDGDGHFACFLGTKGEGRAAFVAWGGGVNGTYKVGKAVAAWQ